VADPNAVERARLLQLLAIREGKSGYKANVAAIKKRLAELDQQEAKNV
jgi:hypothetical protein